MRPSGEPSRAGRPMTYRMTGRCDGSSSPAGHGAAASSSRCSIARPATSRSVSRGQSVQKRIDVHRLVALTFLGDPPSSRHLVAHADGNRTNNRVSNLRWATQSENLSDCRRHGTALIGSRNPATSLVELDVQAMRRMKVLGIPRLVIAEGYGLHRRQVFRILARESWGHVA